MGGAVSPSDQGSCVFLLYHVSHVGRIEPIAHRNEQGGLLLDPEAGDDVKLLGCYSSDERAQERIHSASVLPGFSDEPECFFVDRYVVDRDEWPEGYENVCEDDEARE